MFLAVAPAVFALGPWATSRVGPRWTSVWNLVGLIPVAAGVAVLAWVMVTALRHARELPDRVSLDFTPKLLLRGGPYAFSRNPMYVAEQGMWIGWSLFHGSLVSAACTLVVFAGQSLLIRREERELRARFGDAYRDYVAAVPRWIGRAP
jgi:protein-S-isoprenylcysteine O-methyltransferase Ste14